MYFLCKNHGLFWYNKTDINITYESTDAEVERIQKIGKGEPGMANSSFLTDIQLIYNQFTKAEKKIADYILKNADKVLFMSISDLADACDVADASVYRFCRSIGAKGYQEFKMKLSLSFSPDETVERINDLNEDGPGELQRIADTILEKHIAVLRETRNLIDFAEIEKAVDMMADAERIFFFGVGNSLLIAQTATNKFLKITRKVSCISDTHTQAMVASLATERDMFIFISYSGSTKDNVYVAKIVKEVGAKVITISRFLKSPLTAYSDILLLCGADEEPLGSGSTEAKFGQLYMIDLLFSEYYNRNGAESAFNNRKTTKAVAEKLF